MCLGGIFIILWKQRVPTGMQVLAKINWDCMMALMCITPSNRNTSKSQLYWKNPLISLLHEITVSCRPYPSARRVSLQTVQWKLKPLLLRLSLSPHSSTSTTCTHTRCRATSRTGWTLTWIARTSPWTSWSPTSQAKPPSRLVCAGRTQSVGGDGGGASLGLISSHPPTSLRGAARPPSRSPALTFLITVSLTAGPAPFPLLCFAKLTEAHAHPANTSHHRPHASPRSHLHPYLLRCCESLLLFSVLFFFF